METKIEIIKRIKSLRYSLFNDEPTDFSTLGLQETNDDTWAMDSNFNTALSLLRYRKKIDTGIKRDLKVFIEKNLEADPTDIHAWINKCMFEVTNVPANLTRAKEALDQVTSLQCNESAALEARIQDAFWLCTMMNDDIEKRMRGLVIFKDELNGKVSKPRYHYLYMKALENHMIRKAAEEDRSSKKETTTLFSDQVQRLFHSDSPNYRLQMFVCLADVQRHDTGRRVIKELRDRKELKFDISGVPNIRFCMQQIDQIILQNPEIPVSANIYARIALCLLRDAMDGENSQMQENLREALSYAKKYKSGRPSRLPMGPKACARIIFHQWAIEYFDANQENLSFLYHLPYAQKLKYLAEKYHASRPDPKSKKLLEEAHHHLKEHYRLGGPFVAYYPRVLILLGEEPDIVEPIYNKGPYGVPIDRINALEHKGLFLETQRRFQEAHNCWKEAETVIEEKKMGYKSSIVLDGLRRLPTRECDRSDNWRRRDSNVISLSL